MPGKDAESRESLWDVDAAAREAEYQMASLTWGTGGNEALETILICLPGILDASFRAGLGKQVNDGLIGILRDQGE